MNRKEFEEIQEQMAKSLIVYERFLKKSNYLKAKYNCHFGKYTEQELKYRIENDIMINVVKMITEEKSVDEIEQLIEKGKKMYAKTMVDLANEFKHDTFVVYNFENTDLNVMEEIFEKYVRENHPAIKMAISNEEAQVYNALRALYCDNNIPGFENVLELNKNLLSKVEYTEDKFVEYYKYYLKTARDIQNDMEKKLKAFPFDKEEMFKDNISLAAEEGELRVRVNKLSQANKNLHKDLTKLYGEDINL